MTSGSFRGAAFERPDSEAWQRLVAGNAAATQPVHARCARRRRFSLEPATPLPYRTNECQCPVPMPIPPDIEHLLGN